MKPPIPGGRWTRLAVGMLALQAGACTVGNPAFDPTLLVDAGYDGPAGEAAPPAETAPPAEAGRPDLPPDTAAESRGADAALAGNCPNDPDLVLCLRFEASVSNGASTNLPLTSRQVGYEPGPDGQAALLTTSSRIEVRPSSVLDLQRFTIEAWIKPRVLPAAGARMGIVDYTRLYALFLHEGGDLVCDLVTTDGIKSARLAGWVQAGVWSSVACTFDGTNARIFHDGARSAVAAAQPLEPGDGSDTLVVGGNFADDEPDPYEGTLDNVRIWRRARTQAELCASAAACPTR